MHTYTAYGLTVASDIELPELLPSSGHPDVYVKRQALPTEGPDAFSNGETRIAGRVLDVLRFSVENGTHILFDEMRPVEDAEIRVFVLGVLMSILLRQRGLYVLHASGLSKDGRAIAFVGDSGWGKSTLAGYFVKQGYQILNDDVLAVDLSTEPVQVIPGHPQIKFRPEAEQWLGQRFDTLRPLHESSIKRVTIPFEGFQRSAVPLARLYVLEGFGRETSAVEDLRPRDALLELIRHSRVTNVMKAPDVQARHLRQTEELIKRVPVKRLARKKDLEALAEILSVVEQDLAASSA